MIGLQQIALIILLGLPLALVYIGLKYLVKSIIKRVLVLECRNVLTKGARFQISYIVIMFVAFGKFYNFRVPYFIRKGLSSEQIKALDEVIKKLEGLK